MMWLSGYRTVHAKRSLAVVIAVGSVQGQVSLSKNPVIKLRRPTRVRNKAPTV